VEGLVEVVVDEDEEVERERKLREEVKRGR
jgi:hypothetical protein